MALADSSPATRLVTITNHDVIASPYTDFNANAFTLASTAWPSNNRAVATPIYLSEPGTVVKLFVHNGASVSGNVDVGIYNDSFTLLVSAGSTAQAGTSAIQTFDTTDTYLPRGRYWLATASSTTAATFMAHGAAPATDQLRIMGVVQMASALALPSTLTPAAPTTAFLNICGFTYRVTI